MCYFDQREDLILEMCINIMHLRSHHLVRDNTSWLIREFLTNINNV